MRWGVWGWFKCVLILVLVSPKTGFTPPSQLLKTVQFVSLTFKIGSENCVAADLEIGSENCITADSEIGSENCVPANFWQQKTASLPIQEIDSKNSVRMDGRVKKG